MVNLLDVIRGITGFDRGEQTSLSVTDGRTPKMPPDSKTTAISKLQSTAEELKSEPMSGGKGRVI